MKILIETQSLDDGFSQITESVDEKGNKSYYIEGIFMQSEIVNGNKRIYPKAVLSEAVQTLSTSMKKSRLLGELNHPTEGSASINPDRAAILIQELNFRGNDVYGKAKVLKTVPCGAIVHGLLSEGVSLGVSSRGFGDAKKNEQGISVIQSPLILKTVDVVTEPSAPDAYVTAVMENKEWVYINGELIEQDLKKIINTDTAKKVDLNETFRKLIDYTIMKQSKKVFH